MPLHRLRSHALWLAPLFSLAASAAAAEPGPEFPIALERYADAGKTGVWEILRHRTEIDAFNIVALAIFACAIAHTFLTARIRHWGHLVEMRHRRRMAARASRLDAADRDGEADEVSFAGQILHFMGEVEVVFGIWAVVLMGAISWAKGWGTAVHYLSDRVSYTEPMFVAIAMTLAATRPILALAEWALSVIAGLGRRTAAAWWLTILIVAPLLGSLITEPAAMTIAALLLSRQFYDLKPSARLAYATIGLLFVNISVGGTLTHFAAPPVVMVANTWNWDLLHMLGNFGWRALAGILASTLIYFAIFRRELRSLGAERNDGAREARRVRIPVWIAAVQIGFLSFIIWQSHRPVMFVGAFLFYLAFAQATAHHQNPIDLRSPILVGFFLAGLVIHGGLQAWWIEPILSRLHETPLFLTATGLTAFNDNAAITYLASLVPGFTDALKYSVVAGAVVGGGLTVIANAPNPAGQAILSRHFPGGVAPLRLFAAALLPTAILSLAFLFL